MMSLPNDGSGRAPVAIVSPTTSVTSGVEVTKKLVGAAIAFGDLLAGTLGPNGLDKMMYKTNGQTAVTNDGAKIVAELLVKHPAAKAFVALAQSQENACGDGVTSCLLIASNLMREAGRLFDKKLHPLVLVDGYQKALDITLQTLESKIIKIRSDSIDDLRKVAKTAMGGTSAEAGGDLMADLVVTAAQLVAGERDGNLHISTEDVRMSKRGVGSIGDSRIIAGLIIEKRLELDRLPKSLDAGKVLVLSCPLQIESTTRDVEIEVEDAEQWASFMDAEEEKLQLKTQQVINSGASLVFTAEGVEARILHALVDAGIFVLGGLEKAGAEDIALATGARMIDHLDDISQEIMGDFSELKIEILEGAEGRRERIHLLVGQQTGIATIDVGGGDGVASEEVIRGLYDALCSVTSAMETGEVLTGGGSLHMAASLAIKEAAENHPGRERLAMEAFSRALESVPATLGENAGVNRLDCLLELRALHRAGNSEAGVMRDGKAGTIEEALASAETLSHAIEAACETACGLLRVDQVISARGD